MLHSLHKALAAVRFRLRLARTLDWLMMGLIIGAVLGLVIEVSRLSGQSYSPWTSWLLLGGITLVTTVAAFLAPTSWLAAARQVDRHFCLQDRTATALAFAQVESPEAIKQLQITDALERLHSVVPEQAVSLRIPKSSLVTTVALALLIGIACVPRGGQAIDPALAQLQQVVNDQAATLEETMLDDLQTLIEKHPEPELKELTEELAEMIQELKAPEVNQREALAKLSEMQQALAAAIENLDLQKTDAQLQEFAAALEPAESMKSLAEMLKAGKYDKAAEKLEQFDTKDLDRKQREALAQNMKKFKKDLGEGQQGELSDAAQEIQEGLENENESQCKSGQCKAAGLCKSQGLKKSISQCLSCQLNRLSQCKSNCQNPGQCNSTRVAKSDNPSNKAGKGASNKPLGEEKTSLDSGRTREDITGIQGDGPAEREVSNSPEGEQDATRTYSQKYTEFRKQMEEVLDNEPLPLGHRETVRKYFESIRPTQDQ